MDLDWALRPIGPTQPLLEGSPYVGSETMQVEVRRTYDRRMVPSDSLDLSGIESAQRTHPHVRFQRYIYRLVGSPC